MPHIRPILPRECARVDHRAEVGCVPLTDRLRRPKIGYLKACSFLTLTVTSAWACAILVGWVIEASGYEASSAGFHITNPYLLFTFTFFTLVFATLRYYFVFAIRLYQRFASAETRLRCRWKPSCSEYGVMAIQKYGAIWGAVITVQRLRRCMPPGGVDYP